MDTPSSGKKIVKRKSSRFKVGSLPSECTSQSVIMDTSRVPAKGKSPSATPSTSLPQPHSSTAGTVNNSMDMSEADSHHPNSSLSNSHSYPTTHHDVQITNTGHSHLQSMSSTSSEPSTSSGQTAHQIHTVSTKPKKLSQIKEVNDCVQSTVKVLVIKLSEARTHTKQDKSTSTRANGIIVDETASKDICFVGAKAIENGKLALRKKDNFALHISDFTSNSQGDTIFVNYNTKMTFVKEIMDIPQDVMASSVQKKNQSIYEIFQSPLKSRVNTKGKIVKISPLKDRTIRSTGAKMDFRELVIKDQDQEQCKVSLWGANATLLPFTQNMTIGITNGQHINFKGEHVLNTYGTTKIEVLPDDGNISDTSEDPDLFDDEPVRPKGTVLNISSIHVYRGCKKCYYKKMDIGGCPKCGQQNSVNSMNCMISIDNIEKKAFSQVLYNIIVQNTGKVVEDVENLSMDKIEDMLMDLIGLRVEFDCNASGYFTTIKKC